MSRYPWTGSKALMVCSILVLAVMFCQNSYGQGTMIGASIVPVLKDLHGKPAGHYSTTPFPISETTDSYVIKTDEHPTGKTYYLGTKYYVDARAGNDSNDGLSLAKAKRTIKAAIKAAGSGNKTIIVKAGVYKEQVSLNGISGSDDTHRFTIVGYKNERPIIDGANSKSSIITRGDSRDAYITIQRLKLQNTQASGVRLGWDVSGDKRDGYFSCIDIWFYQCGNNTTGYATSGSCYYLNVDYGWVYHCTSERTYGHGYKMGDGASHGIIEWSIARYIGYWPGGPMKKYFQNAVGFDFPTDNDSRNAHDIICRYNLSDYTVNYALQVRRVRDFKVYNNTFRNAVFHDKVLGSEAHGTLGRFMVILFAGQTSGDFYNNTIGKPGSTATDSLLISSLTTGDAVVNVYNNMISDSTQRSVYIDYSSVPTAKINLSNNTIVAQSASSLIDSRMAGEVVSLKKNVLRQLGTGLVLKTGTAVREDNLLYHPLGLQGIGTTLTATERLAN